MAVNKVNKALLLTWIHIEKKFSNSFLKKKICGTSKTDLINALYILGLYRAE